MFRTSGFRIALSLVSLSLVGGAGDAFALDLDWSGQFRSEAHYVRGYTLDEANQLNDTSRSSAGGYYVPGGGQRSAHFQTLFLRLRPKIVVNDNVYIKSELWLGDPVFGLFGNGAPTVGDQRQYYSTQSRGSSVTAQRLWGEVLTDIGTVQVGRAPLHWGLGLVYNNGDGLWDRYQSTGDTVRLVSKFGAFSFSPAVTKFSMGNTIGGASSSPSFTPVPGGGGMSDYSLEFKYENPDEDFEGGVNFVKRLAGAAQDPSTGFFGVTGATAGSNFNTWDIFGRKKLGRFSLSGELPITNGDIGGIPYKSWAVALEGTFKFSESFESTVRAGRAPGQQNHTSAKPGEFKAFYFHPSYRIANIMFNYQLANFSGNNRPNDSSAVSPWDNPITNASYVSWGATIRADKWTFRGGVTYARAQETAAAGAQFFNTWQRRFFTANGNQGNSLGMEFDLGTTFTYDENFMFALDTGIYSPGDYYKFANVTGVENGISSVQAVIFRAGVNF